MQKETIHNIVEKQKAYFLTGATLNVEERIKNLKKLHFCHKCFVFTVAFINFEIDFGKRSQPFKV